MFCNQCGKKLVSDSKFCSSCGSQVVAEAEPDPAPSSAWDNLDPTSAACAGFVNVEQGSVWISDRPIYTCDACRQGVNNFQRPNCSKCGKNADNYLSVPMGKGDGTYPVLSMSAKAGTRGSLLAILASDAQYSSPFHETLVSAISGKLSARSLGLKLLAELSVLLNSGNQILNFGSLRVDPRNVVHPNLSNLVFSGPRTFENLDCAEVRVSVDADEYSVLAVVSAESNLDSESRPEVLAILMVPQSISNLIPQNSIIELSDTNFLRNPDVWIEAARVSRGDLPAIWANYYLASDIGSEAQAKSPQGHLHNFQHTLTEGYLHQIWTWCQDIPSSLEGQFNSLETSLLGFSELIQFAEDPQVPREHLIEWFR